MGRGLFTDEVIIGIGIRNTKKNMNAISPNTRYQPQTSYCKKN